MDPREKTGWKVDVQWGSVNWSGDRCFIMAGCLQATYK